MKALRILLICGLAAVAAGALAVDVISPRAYDEQFRSDFDEGPSMQYPLGTDELGRDRLVRLLHGVRTSLLLAPAAAAVAVTLAAAAALAGTFAGRFAVPVFDATIDLFASLPWLFLLITIRAALPLDVSAAVTAATTYAVLAAIAWAGPARVLRNALGSLANDDFMTQAHALGLPRWRAYCVHLLPHLGPLLFSQMLVSIPVFIIGEANLGVLGLGVPEPIPSLGGLLRDLETYPGIFDRPWVLAPVAALVLVIGGVQALGARRREA